MKDLLDLYLVYMKIGFINFGGGYAMLPLLERELVTRRGWTTMDELRDYFAIGQCTPGLIALNVSTFIGSKRKGVPGALAAMLGFLTGPISMILVIAAFLQNFASIEIVQHAFAGIRACVCVLILNAVVKLWKKSVIDWKTGAIFAVVFLGSVFLHLSPVIYVILAAAAGILLKRLEVKA